MAVVTFYEMWINPIGEDGFATDDGMGIGLSPKYTVTPQTPGEIRQYGSSDPANPGRLRFVSSAVRSQQISVPLMCENREQVAFLEANQGFPGACFRDPFGRKFYGVYTDLSIPEAVDPDVDGVVAVTFTVNEITVSELTL